MSTRHPTLDSAEPATHSSPSESGATPESLGVRFIEHTWIPMPDGTRLGARLWLPQDAHQHPVPALLHYNPYRQRGDAAFASRGYALVIADVRGTGQSEGDVQDEYVEQEQDDAVEIIAWIAEQPWCNGKVGMFGSSWSGFGALQTAARRPPALKAIIAQCCSDDRYADDAHYLGGCLVQEMFVWGSLWTALTPLPPDPTIVGEAWRDMWLRRLNSLEFYVGDWLQHQHRDAFWKHGSVNEDFSQIKCAVYAVGGLADPYHPAVPRLLAGLTGPRKGLVGPWGHSTFASPGPSIDWLQEALRWWDYWLKDIDTGIMSEPMYRVWMQDEEAILGNRTVAGRWVAEEAWPSPRIGLCRYFLTDEGIADRPASETARSIKSPQTVGISAPHLCPFDLDTEMPTEQSIDDARSLTFDSEPLQEDVDLLGEPVVTLHLSVDKPVAFIAVRLNDVTAAGNSTRVTFAVLNLTHRDSHEHPAPLEVGKRYQVRIPLRHHAHVFKAGHRLRVSISTTYWPLIWPSPEAVTLTVYAGQSELSLPIRAPRAEDAQLSAFGESTAGAQPAKQPTNAGQPTAKLYEWDVRERKLTIRSRPLDLVGTGAAEEVLEIRDNDPTSATLEYRRTSALRRETCDVSIETTLKLSVTERDYLLSGEIRAYEHEKEVFVRDWQRTIVRSLV